MTTEGMDPVRDNDGRANRQMELRNGERRRQGGATSSGPAKGVRGGSTSASSRLRQGVRDRGSVPLGVGSCHECPIIDERAWQILELVANLTVGAPNDLARTHYPPGRP